jgi:Flp pilus assembly protein TadD
LTIDPKNPDALNGKGLYLLKNDQLVKAYSAFKSCVLIAPKFVPAYNNLAITLERLNRKKEAMVLLKKALTIEPGNEEIQKNLERMKAAG